MKERVLAALNGRFLDRELTGVERYAHELLARLGPELRVIRPAHRLSPMRGHAWEQFTLSRLCRGEVLWSPANTGPLAVTNQVVTVHDASTLDHPEWFSGKFAIWYRFLLPRLAQRVRKILTVSEFSKERLVRACRIPEDKVVVIYNGIGSQFEPATEEAVEVLRTRHKLERPYFLFVGSLEPRKNVVTLLKAWADHPLPGYELVLAGAAGHVFRDRGFAELPPGVRLFGRVNDEEMPALLTAARCFVYPSLYEGFGFPPLEAMACGCPVICSDATCLPEVCGPGFDAADPASTGAALYFDPAKSDELAARMKGLLEMDAMAVKRMVQNGRVRAKWFTWDRCAAQVRAVLEELNG